MPTDHHLALGVRPDAGPEEIRAAYLRVMRDHHPDRRPGDPVAAETARRANVAYRALRDPPRAPATDGGGRLGGRVTPAGAAASRATAQADRAYSAAQREYRQTFSRACLRVGVAVLLAGAALLFAVT
ncbi:MAG: J domain-containing protein [Egibacteraceae bacterium]